MPCSSLQPMWGALGRQKCTWGPLASQEPHFFLEHSGPLLSLNPPWHTDLLPKGPFYTTPFILSYPLLTPPSGLNLEATSTRKSSLMLLGGSSLCTPHPLCSPAWKHLPIDCDQQAGGH